MAVGISVILIFLILYGFVAGDLSKAPDWMKITFGILAGLFTLAVVLYVSGLGSILLDWVSGGNSSTVWSNVIMVILVIAVMVIAVVGGKKKKDD
jgi:hypothetical protein